MGQHMNVDDVHTTFPDAEKKLYEFYRSYEHKLAKRGDTDSKSQARPHCTHIACEQNGHFCSTNEDCKLTTNEWWVIFLCQDSFQSEQPKQRSRKILKHNLGGYECGRL